MSIRSCSLPNSLSLDEKSTFKKYVWHLLGCSTSERKPEQNEYRIFSMDTGTDNNHGRKNMLGVFSDDTFSPVHKYIFQEFGQLMNG